MERQQHIFDSGGDMGHFLHMLAKIVVGLFFHVEGVGMTVLFCHTAYELVLTHSGELHEVLMLGIDTILLEGMDGRGTHQKLGFDQHAVHIEEDCFIFHDLPHRVSITAWIRETVRP